MDEFIESETVSYAYEKYGVHAVGESGQERILTIRMENEQHKGKVKKYFEKSLKDVGIDYKVRTVHKILIIFPFIHPFWSFSLLIELNVPL